MPKRSEKRSKKRPDWKAARALYEREHKTFVEIAKVVGARRETVSKHARRDGWKRAHIAHDALALATEKAAAQVAAAIAPQVLDSLREAERQRQLVLHVNARMLEGLVRSVSPTEAGAEAPTIVFGLGSSPDLVLRRCALNINTALGKSDGDGPSPERSDADTAARAARVRASLDELERAGSRARRRDPEVPVPD